MTARTILAAIFLILGLIAARLTWLMWQVGDSGKWFFGVFALFFLILAAAPFLPAPKKKSAEVQSTRFVPAWKMEGMILLAVVFVALALIVPHCVHHR
ncbi:MAG: hypothetical protein KGJ37_05000 [Verrucomicrobiota bacterium]|nr:hypothetical protein [Verrucomicrobiota bacterium]